MRLRDCATSVCVWGAAAGLIAELSVVTLTCPAGMPIVCGPAEMCESMGRDTPCAAPPAAAHRIEPARRIGLIPREARVVSSCAGSPCQGMFTAQPATPVELESSCHREPEAPSCESPCGRDCDANRPDERDEGDEDQDRKRAPGRCPDRMPACCLILVMARAPILPDSSRDPGATIRALASVPALHVPSQPDAPTATDWRSHPTRGSPANPLRAQLCVWLN